MNLEEIKNEFGDQLAFYGLISTQQTLPFGTVDQCRDEALHRTKVVGRNGGYFFAPAHCIQPDTPLENILVIYEVANGVEQLGEGTVFQGDKAAERENARTWEKSTAHA